MISLITPKTAQLRIAASLRQLRLIAKLRQQDLSAKSGVALASLRKFERTGYISLESFLKLAVILGVLDNVVAAVTPNADLPSIDAMLAQAKSKTRQRAR